MLEFKPRNCCKDKSSKSDVLRSILDIFNGIRKTFMDLAPAWKETLNISISKEILLRKIPLLLGLNLNVIHQILHPPSKQEIFRIIYLYYFNVFNILYVIFFETGQVWIYHNHCHWRLINSASLGWQLIPILINYFYVTNVSKLVKSNPWVQILLFVTHVT